MKAAKPWYLYLIECVDGSIYTGITVDLDARYAAHQDGSGARYALVFGAQELEQGMVAVKHLRGDRGGEAGQQLQPLQAVATWGPGLLRA